MGCGTSGTAVLVQPMRPPSGQGEAGSSKHGGHRGDSAASKTTTDSGVVMDPSLVPPGPLPRKLPPLTASPGGVSARHGPAPEEAGPVERRPASSQILEQLQSQGIIPAELPRDRSTVPGETYSTMLSDGESSMGRCRLPARLESLQSRSSTEENLHHNTRLEEETRKEEEEEEQEEGSLARELEWAEILETVESDDTFQHADEHHHQIF